MVKNKELHKELELLVTAASNLISSGIKTKNRIPVIRVTDYSVEVLSSGGTCRKTIPKEEIDYLRLIKDYADEIEKLEQYNLCIQFMSGEDILRKNFPKCFDRDNNPIPVENLDTKTIKHLLWDVYIVPLLTITLSKTKLSFDPKIFDIEYEKLENYLYSDKVGYIAQAILENFDCDEDIIELGNGVKIRKLALDEHKDIWRQFDDRGSFNSEYIIEMYHYINKTQPHSLFEPEEYFNKIVAALRIFKNGLTGYNHTLSKRLGWGCELRIPYLSAQGTLTPVSFFGGTYHLKKEEVEQFLDFWKKFNNKEILKDKSLMIAIDRFNIASERKDLKDKLIDYIISLEALYLDDGEGEFRYKLSMRGAVFLGVIKDRPEICDNLKEAYKMRGKIVHGKEVEIKGLSNLLEKIEDYIRESIKKIIDIHQSNITFKLTDYVDKKLLGID